MVTLFLRYIVDWRFLKCGYIRCTVPSISPMNGENNQMFIAYLGKKSVFFFVKKRPLELKNVITHAFGGHVQYADGYQKGLASFGTIFFSSRHRVTKGSAKEIYEIVDAHIRCLFYSLILSSRGTDDCSFRFDRNISTREQELGNKTTKLIYQVSINWKMSDVLENTTETLPMV